MKLETKIEDIALEHAEIVTAQEIRQTMLHDEVSFVVHCVHGETASRYLCRKILKQTENNN